jgi:predicted O-linked N-acetylglucosamine transferase (SPINDLY family)
MLNLVVQLLEQGKVQQALPLLAEQCEKTPRDAHAWFLLGACYHQANQFEDALQALERTLAIEPRHIQARCAKGAVLCDLGRQQEALHVYRKALHLAPTDAQLLLNLGFVLEQMGDLRAALERYDLALKYHPEFSSALLNRGALLIRLGQLEEALSNNRHLADLHPDWEHAQFNLGEVLLALGRWEEALAAYALASVTNSRSAKIHFATGLALSMLKRFDQARQEFLTTQAIDPAVFDQCLRDAAASTGAERLRKFSPEMIYLLKEATRLDSCDWGNWDGFVADFESLINSKLGQAGEIVEPALMFRVCALPVSATASLALARSVSARVAEKAAPFSPFTHDKKHTGKLRIGYVSPDFRIHPIATVTRRLYALHDRGRFEVYGYSLHPGDGSSIRRDIENGCDVFRELSGLDDRTAAEIIHRDGIDILIDLAGYTTHSRTEIFAMRPAPLQASYLGFLHTTGADFIDYIMADLVVVPATSARFFTEKIAYLPNSYFLFDNQQEISAQTLAREELGLPAQGFVFCCHNSNYKITPRDFDIWMRLLKRVAGSVLWLYKSSEAVAVNLRKEAEARGVNPGRLVFATRAPNAEYLARYRMADLFLDTAFYNAQTTAAEALWMGLPVLTCPGASMASRVASGLLRSVGLEEMITGSPQEYEERAYHLATHADELQQVREKLARNRLSTTLFDTGRQVRHLEAAYQTMWQRRETGQAPESFEVATPDVTS